MTDPDFLTSVGIRMQDIMAGLAGGVVNAFVFKRSNPMAIVGSVVVGALTANYLSEPASKITGTSGGATAFILGLCAMAVCQSLVEMGSKWKPKE
jgi:hypothetical protein